MRVTRGVLLASIVLVIVLVSFASALLAQQEEKSQVGRKEQITLASETRAGDTLLKPGDYQIQHIFGPNDHVMVFTELIGSRGPVGPRPGKEVARVKCTLESLDKKAERTEIALDVNSAGQTTLKKIYIKGEKAGHVFEPQTGAGSPGHEHD